jgi:hypothetical protein
MGRFFLASSFCHAYQPLADTGNALMPLNQW